MGQCLCRPTNARRIVSDEHSLHISIDNGTGNSYDPNRIVSKKMQMGSNADGDS
jgi:hypothetical protein